MAVPRQLSKPPITEALLDIKAAMTAPPEAYEALGRELRLRYPKVEQRRGIRAEWKIENGKVLPSEPEDLGFQGAVLRSEDGNTIVQFRPDGFTFNNLNTYIGGDRLIVEALGLWELFVARAQPVAVSRVGFRFINQLKLPFQPGDQFSRFLTGAPPTPEGAPQYVSEFLSRVVAQETEENLTTVITTQQLSLPEPNLPLVVLDIDAFRQDELSPEAANLRPIIDDLRDVKNRAFFALVTEEAVNLYV